MPLPAYDSPTFLGRKDKFLLGLTMNQLGFCLVSLLLWYLVASQAVGGGWMRQAAVIAPGHGATMAVLLVRIAGISVPMYGLLFVQRLIKKPLWESDRDVLINGAGGLEAESESGEAEPPPSGLRGKLLALVRRRSDLTEERRFELEAEGEQAMEQSVRSGHQFIRDGLRALWRGG